MIFHFLFHLVKMFKSYFGAEYKAVHLSMEYINPRMIFVTSSPWCTRSSMVVSFFVSDI